MGHKFESWGVALPLLSCVVLCRWRRRDCWIPVPDVWNFCVIRTIGNCLVPYRWHKAIVLTSVAASVMWLLHLKFPNEFYWDFSSSTCFLYAPFILCLFNQSCDNRRKPEIAKFLISICSFRQRLLETLRRSCALEESAICFGLS